MDQTILHHARRGDLSPLRELTAAQLHSFLREFLEREARATTLDDDALTQVGTSIARSDHEGADDVVLAWLAGAPSSSHLAVTSAFLSGYWRNTKDPPDLPKIERLLAFMRGLTPEDQGWRYAANTALLLYRSADMPLHARDYLRRAVEGFRDAMAASGSHSFLVAHFTRFLE